MTYTEETYMQFELNDRLFQKVLNGETISMYALPPFEIANFLHKKGYKLLNYEESRNQDNLPEIIVRSGNATTQIETRVCSIYGLSKMYLVSTG